MAGEVGCAKGLLNYHFNTKDQLVALAAERLLADRESLWKEALDTQDPDAAISQAWELIKQEADSGFWRAWTSLSASSDKVTVRTVNTAIDSFSRTLGKSVDAVLASIGLSPTIAVTELGHLVGAAVQGFGMQLASGVPESHVEGAHAALWVSILALTRPAED